MYRVLGPLDRIVQVAAECNREGELHAVKVIIFELAEGFTQEARMQAELKRARLLSRPILTGFMIPVFMRSILEGSITIST